MNPLLSGVAHKARWRAFACTRTRVQWQSETVGMICRRIAGPLVGQESRLRMMLSMAAENIVITLNAMRTTL